MGQVKKLMTSAFNNELSDADEALLDMLEAEWLATLQAQQLEDYDYYSMGKNLKSVE